MANTAKIHDKELAKLSEGPAGSPIYLQQQRRALERFETHLKNNKLSLFLVCGAIATSETDLDPICCYN